MSLRPKPQSYGEASISRKREKGQCLDETQNLVDCYSFNGIADSALKRAAAFAFQDWVFV